MSKTRMKEDIYDAIHGEKGYEPKGGLLSWLYSRLTRYEQNRYQAVLKLLERRKRLLDLGCGDGSFAVSAKGNFNEVHGLDVSHINIVSAKDRISGRKDKGKFHFKQHDIDENLPFRQSF